MNESPSSLPAHASRAHPGLWLPIAILLLMCVAAAVSLPVLPIDETRYLSVAWEMYDSGSLVVPLQNGLPYSHKPPLLFWLIQAGWALFGVNAITPRFTVCAISILCLVLLRGISLRLWPGERSTASFSTLVLGSMWVWMLWSSAIMFDILVTCMTLLCVMGALDFGTHARKRGWWMLALGIAGGILTKGPVIFVYTLPLILLYRFRTGERWRVLWALLGACALGFALSLLWVVPAVMKGGDAYRHALLWSQTMERVGESFSHQRPFWWYIPVLPALLLPWLLYVPALRGINPKPADRATWFALIWIAVPFLIFSAISCKQVQYLIPTLPAAALLMGRSIARDEGSRVSASARALGGLLLALGLAEVLVPFSGRIASLRGFDAWPVILAGAVSLGAGLWLIRPCSTAQMFARRLAMALGLTAASAIFGAGRCLLNGYDLQGIAQAIHRAMEKGHPVAHAGKYHSQYHFLGRLTHPITILPGGSNSSEQKKFLIDHPDGLVVSNIGPRDRLPDGAVVIFQQPFRMKRAVVLWTLDQALLQAETTAPQGAR